MQQTLAAENAAVHEAVPGSGPHAGNYSYKDPSFGGALSQGYDFFVPPLQGAGSAQINVFIQSPKTCGLYLPTTQ